MSSSPSDLQRVWLSVQSERNQDVQCTLLCEEMFPLFSRLCTNSSSVAYKSTFGNGKALASVVCRTFSRVADHAGGVNTINTTLSSQRYAVLLSYLSTLLEPEYYRVANGDDESRIEATLAEMRVDILRHDIFKIMLSLHNTLLAAVSDQEVTLSDGAVAAEQTHLALFKCLLETGDGRVLAEASALRCFQAIVSTLRVCFSFPFRGSSSLTRMATDALDTVLGSDAIYRVVAPETVVRDEERSLITALAEDAKRADETFDTVAKGQKLCTLSHIIHAIHGLRAASRVTDAVRFDPIISSFLSLQNVMGLQRSVVDTLFEDYLRFAFINVTVVAPKKKDKGITGVFGLKSKLTSMVFAKEEVHVDEVRYDPECISKAIEFINRSTYREPRLWFASRVCECLMKVGRPDGPNGSAVTAAILNLCQQAPAYDAELLRKILGTLDFIAPKGGEVDLIPAMRMLCQNLSVMEPPKQELVVRFFTTLASSNDSQLLKSVGASGIVAATCVLIDKMSASVDDLEIATIDVAETVFCLWKILLMTDTFINDFISGKSLQNLIRCTLVPTVTSNNVKFVVASRNALVSLIQQRKQSVETLLDAILSREKREWTPEITRHIINLAVTIYGAHCHEEVIGHNGITIVLSLLQYVKASENFGFNLHVIGFVLSMLLPHVRWSDAPSMLVNSMPPALANTPEAVRFAIVVGCGVGVQSHLLANMLDQCYGDMQDPSVDAVRFIEDSVPQSRLCEVEPLIGMLATWYATEPTDVCKEALFFLADAHRTPIADATFCRAVLANDWMDMIPYVADLQPLAEMYVDTDTALRNAVEKWYAATRRVPARHAVTFLGKGNGGAVGRVQMPTPAWPPINGTSISGWFFCSPESANASFSTPGASAQSNCIPIWRLRWDYGADTETALVLVLDSVNRVLFFSKEAHKIDAVTAPAEIGDQWTHICVVMNRWQNEVCLYVNGLLAGKHSMDYPVVLREGGVLATNRLDVSIGFPPGSASRKQPVYQQSLSMLGFQIFDGPLMVEHIHNLVATSFHVRDPTLAVSAGSTSLALTAPVLSDPLLRKLSTVDINTTVRQAAAGNHGRLRLPEVPALVSVHPLATTLIAGRGDGRALVGMGMHNLTSIPFMCRMHGRYSKPPTFEGSPIGFFLAHVGPQQWLDWLGRVEDLGPEHAALLLDVIGDAVMEGLEVAELMERDHFYKMAGIILKNAAFFSQPSVLPALMRLMIRPINRHGIIVNGALSEMLLINWGFLSNLSYDAAITVLCDIGHTMNANSPFAKLNAWRLRKLGFVDGFLGGLLRFCVIPQVLGEARNVIDRFLHALLWDHSVIGEVSTFLAASVPRSKDIAGLLAKFSSPFPPFAMAQIDASRNIVLAALLRVVTTASLAAHDLSSSLPPSWFPLMTGEGSHPVTASLALNIFAVLYTTFSSFRTRCAKNNTLRALQCTLAHHATHSDIIGTVVELMVNTVRDVFKDARRVIDVSPTRAHVVHPSVVPLLMELTKRCGLTLRPSAFSVPNVLTAEYFQMYREGPMSRFRVAVVTVRAALRMQRLSGLQTVAVSESPKVGTNANTENDRQRRADLISVSLDFTAKLVLEHEAVAKVFLQREGSFGALESLSWSVIASTDVAELSESVNEDPRAVKRSGSDDSLDGLSGDHFGASDTSTMDEAKYPMLLNASLLVYLALLRSNIGAYESFTANAQSVKTCEFVYWLHTILCSHPPGIGDRSRAWFQMKVLEAWLHRSAELTRSQTDDAIATANKAKNSHQVGMYIVERLTAGFAVPIKALASYLIFLGNFTSNSEIVKGIRMAMVDLVLYVISEQYHGWEPERVSASLAMFHEYRDQVFKVPLPTQDLVKLFTRRLLEISLVVNTRRSDADPDVMTNDEKDLADLWQQLMTMNKGSPVFSLLLVDGGPGTGRPRSDLLFGGFDRVQSTGIRETDKTAFIMWMYANDARIREMIHVNPNAAADQKFTTSIPKRAHAWSARTEDELNLDRGGQRTRNLEAERAADTLWMRHAATGCVVDASLLDVGAGVDNFHLRPFIAIAPPLGVVGPAFIHLGGACGTATSASGQGYLLQNGAVPLGSLLSHASDGCTPINCPSLDPGDGASSTIKPTTHKVLEKLLDGNSSEVRGAPILWAGNIYHVTNNESFICVMVITSFEVLIISSAQITADGSLYIASLSTHEANKTAQKKAALVKNVLRRFIPNAPIPTSLTIQSLATFRHSQYFRQLRTEAKAVQRDSKVWRFPLATIGVAHHRHFQHEPAGIEFVLEDNTRMFVVVLDNDMVMSREARQTVMDIVADQAPHVVIESNTAKRSRVANMQRKWIRRQVSNYDYLMAVNDAASRTFGDLTQYPVMPWVLSCYNEMFVDLEHTRYYRDLSRPVGAIDETRRKEITARYSEWLDDTTPPFHYGTHYSTSAIVMYFLVRLQPLANYAMAYQGGKLDVADRLFHSVEEAWKSCSGVGGRDVKELIPEFFSQQLFLTNSNHIDLGTRRDGVTLGDVQIPFWATSTAAFISTNREALESDTVSAALNFWIDLIFGCKQDGPEAVAACNVFHHLTYAKGFEEAMTSAAEEEDRKAIVASVDNFGLTPKSVFKAPHPRRVVYHQYRSQQDFFMQNLAQLQLKPASGQVCDVHCAGQPITGIVEYESTFLLSTFSRRTTSVRPLQHFVIDVVRNVVINFRTKDQCTTVLPDISPFGIGRIQTFDCCPSGNVTYVGTTLGSVVVFTRSSWTARHKISHILHTRGREPVEVLTYLGGGRLAVGSGTLLDVWHIARRGVTYQWGCNVSRAAINDPSSIKGVCLTTDALDAVVVVKERSLYVVVQEEIVTSTLADRSVAGDSLFTTVAYVGFSSFSPTGMLCCGHSDGRVSFWSLTINYKPRGTAEDKRDNYVLSHVSTRQVDAQSDANAITSILPQPQLFSLIVGCKSGALWNMGFPQQLTETYYAEV